VPTFDIWAKLAALKDTSSPLAAAERRLQDRCEQLGLHRSQVEKDGNCQFESIARGLRMRGKKVRKRVVAWLRGHADFCSNPNDPRTALRHFIVDESWTAFCDRMEKDGKWGEHVTLIAACQAFNRPLVVVSSIDSDQYIIHINPVGGSGEPPVLLAHLHELHYDHLDFETVSLMHGYHRPRTSCKVSYDFRP